MRIFPAFVLLLICAQSVNADTRPGGGASALSAAGPLPATSGDPSVQGRAGAGWTPEEAARFLAQEAETREEFYAPQTGLPRPRSRRLVHIAAGAPADMARIGAVRPEARSFEFPNTRWQHRPEALTWTRAAISALKTHGKPLVRTVPRDIDAWCPAYRQADDRQRRAFWVGFLSALAKHESTWRPEAVGGGGLWYGLLQILPGTARGYRCHARSGEALKNGGANLSCAIRIMSVTVPRDQAIAIRDSRWRGVAADWGPMISASKRREMSAWTRQQTYCKPMSSLRPKARPAQIASALD